MTTPQHRLNTVRVAVGAAVLAAAAVGGLVLATRPSEPAAGPDAEYDLGTPQRAARAFAAAAVAGDESGLLALTCVAHPECVTLQGQVSPDEVEDAKALLRDDLDRLADELGDVEFGRVSEASTPGTVEVDYTTSDAPDGLRQALLFVEVDDEWLYVGSLGAAT